MNIAELKRFDTEKQPSHPPQTARGRAFYTVDWFVNGKPRLSNHDNTQRTFLSCFAGGRHE